MALSDTQSIFSALAEAIVYQQLSGRAAAAIYGRLCDLGDRPEAGLTADELSGLGDDELRAAGVSRPKIRALQDLAAHELAGALPTMRQASGMPDEELIEQLTAVRGVGRWTVEMLLIFRLGRPDVLPATDLGVRKGYARAFATALPEPGEVLERGLRWRPYRSVASWYLWRAAEKPV